MTSRAKDSCGCTCSGGSCIDTAVGRQGQGSGAPPLGPTPPPWCRDSRLRTWGWRDSWPHPRPWPFYDPAVGRRRTLQIQLLPRSPPQRQRPALQRRPPLLRCPMHRPIAQGWARWARVRVGGAVLFQLWVQTAALVTAGRGSLTRPHPSRAVVVDGAPPLLVPARVPCRPKEWHQ